MRASASRLWVSAIQLPQDMERQPVMLQSADGQLVVVMTLQGAMWQVCSGGTCVRAHSGVRLIEQYRTLLVSQGRMVPPG